MDLIKTNLLGTEGSFYEKLSEEGLFDKYLFAEIILYIDGLNSKKLTETERFQKSSQLWELGYKIQSSFGYNYNDNDAYKISNVEEEKLIEIGQVLEYICKSFTENRELDMDFIHEMTE